MTDYEFTTPEPIELFVEIGSGSIEVTAEQIGLTKVRVEGDEHDDVIVTQEGRQVSIRARQQRGRLDFLSSGRDVQITVLVPAGSDLATQCGSADLSARGSYGSGHLRAGSGEIQVEAFGGDVSVSTGSGDIELGAVAGALRSKSGSGDVAVGRLDGAGRLSTGSGDVRLEQVSQAADVKTGSGDVELGRLTGDLNRTSGSGSLRVRELRSGRVQVKTGSGDVDLAIPAGTPVWTDIRSVSGEVRNGLPGVGAPQEGQPHVELRVVTASGDVRLQPS